MYNINMISYLYPTQWLRYTPNELVDQLTAAKAAETLADRLAITRFAKGSLEEPEQDKGCRQVEEAAVQESDQGRVGR